MSASFLKLKFFDDPQELTEFNKNDEFHYRVKPFQDSEIFTSPICKVEKLTQGADVRTSYEISFELNPKKEQTCFSPGDAIAILPQNDEIEVDQLLKRLNVDKVCKKYKLDVVQNCTKKLPAHIPIIGTLQEAFLKYVDIRSVPKKLFLKSLLAYTADETDKQKLELICSPNGSKQYEKFISTHRTLLQLLEALPSCRPPVETILQHSVSLKPRFFSITSPKGSKISIIFSVVEFDNGLKGVCTGWLDKTIQKIGSRSENIVPFYFRKPTDFKILNDNLKRDRIFIANGTGIAPFMGVFRDIKETHSNRTWLLYGCRYNNRDFLCKQEILQLFKNGVIRLNTAFSRDNPEKHYVQDEILKNSEEFVDFLLDQKETARIYVCGSTQMWKDVRKMILECIAKVKEVEISMAEEIFNKLEYFVDSWL